METGVLVGIILGGLIFGAILIAGVWWIWRKKKQKQEVTLDDLEETYRLKSGRVVKTSKKAAAYMSQFIHLEPILEE